MDYTFYIYGYLVSLQYDMNEKLYNLHVICKIYIFIVSKVKYGINVKWILNVNFTNSA